MTKPYLDVVFNKLIILIRGKIKFSSQALKLTAVVVQTAVFKANSALERMRETFQIIKYFVF